MRYLNESIASAERPWQRRTSLKKGEAKPHMYPSYVKQSRHCEAYLKPGSVLSIVSMKLCGPYKSENKSNNRNKASSIWLHQWRV